MSQRVLAYQSVSGLLPELKAKVAGAEGTFDQLWIKARFEEAKLKELTPRSSVNSDRGSGKDVGPGNFRSNNTSQMCYICGQVGHIQRDCPQQCRGKPVEAQRSPPVNFQSGQSRTTTNHVVGEDASDEYGEIQEKISAITKRVASSRGQECFAWENSNNACSGSRRDLLLESPITIVSIDCLLDILAKNRIDGQTVQEWKVWVEEKLRTPSLSVSNYRGGEVNIIS